MKDMIHYIIYMADLNSKNIASINSIYLFLLYGLTGVIIILYSLVIYTYVRMQINDNIRINYGGRLRMLTQKITKDVILLHYGTEEKLHIEHSVKIFNESIHAITQGGSLPINAEGTFFRILPPVDDEHCQNLLDLAINEWDPFKVYVLQFLQQKNGDSYRYILEHNEKLMDTIDRAVLAIEVHANQDQRVLGIVISAGIMIILVVIMYNFISKLKQFRKTSSRLAEIELLLPICSNCKKIRTDNEHPFDPRSWTTIEEYLIDNKDMIFTHSICPDCMTKLYPNIAIEKDKTK